VFSGIGRTGEERDWNEVKKMSCSATDQIRSLLFPLSPKTGRRPEFSRNGEDVRGYPAALQTRYTACFSTLKNG